MAKVKTKVIKSTSLIPTEMHTQESNIKSCGGSDAKIAFLDAKIDKETLRAQLEELNLQEQIDLLNQKSFSVKDVVLHYYSESESDLAHYSTVDLVEGDVIEVIIDETRDNNNSFYRYVNGSWLCIGSSSYSVGKLDDAFTDLRNQLEALGNKSAVRDVVLDKESLDLYIYKSNLVTGDIIIVLTDNSHNDQTTFYSYVKESDSFIYKGLIGPYYTRQQIDNIVSLIYARIDELQASLEEHVEDHYIHAYDDNRVTKEELDEIFERSEE